MPSGTPPTHNCISAPSQPVHIRFGTRRRHAKEKSDVVSYRMAASKSVLCQRDTKTEPPAYLWLMTSQFLLLGGFPCFGSCRSRRRVCICSCKPGSLNWQLFSLSSDLPIRRRIKIPNAAAATRRKEANTGPTISHTFFPEPRNIADYISDSPLPKRAGSWVWINTAKALGIVWRDRIWARTSKTVEATWNWTFEWKVKWTIIPMLNSTTNLRAPDLFLYKKWGKINI